MKRNWNATAGLAIAAAAVVILVGCGSSDPGNSGGGGEQTMPERTAQATQTTPERTTQATPERTAQTGSDRRKGSSKDSKEGATDFQNAVADAVKKRYSNIDLTGSNSHMPTQVGQHKTVPYSALAGDFTCDTVYMGGENVKLSKCLSPTGDPVPDPAPDPAY